ncbi:DNA-binding NarL/FixJ family response regulator [Maribacter vaceletii]|uniref:DNA-binding NarL/FixJ family response regulator n=1 Tax=Maribacter vaceletii TaxID=1206816 RepID=A0A495ECC6_9FLAO|nr:response regulator [Maribacter vaceletii]RKR14279.1 DNA-binding NarL/FixJ family response regulator [Maribacter vaceletii]
MKLIIKILMVDDHPIILKGYELSLNEFSDNYIFEFYKAQNSVEAVNLIEQNEPDFFHIVFLDIRLPVNNDYALINGEDLGIKIRKTTNSKIIVLSSIGDTQRIYSILNNLEPDGYIIKTETTPEILLDAIDAVLNDRNYFSSKIKKLKNVQNSENPTLDVYDIKILYFLSVGEKMKNLPDFVHLSIASIERRKKKIKAYFGNKEASDRQLIEAAKEKGFI